MSTSTKVPVTTRPSASSHFSSASTSANVGDPLNKKSQETKVIEQILEDCDIAEYEPQLVPTVLQLSHIITRKILDEAKDVSHIAGKKQIEIDDAEFAAKTFDEKFHPIVERQRLIETAMEKNNKPLPTIRQNFGMRLPNDRFCLVQPNYQVSSRSIQLLSQRERVDNYSMAESSMDTSYEIRPDQVVGSILGKRKASMEEYD